MKLGLVASVYIFKRSKGSSVTQGNEIGVLTYFNLASGLSFIR